MATGTEPAVIKGVSGFAARMASIGLASPNKFEVEFSQLPNNIVGNMDIQTLNIMCESVTLAGRTVQSVLDRQYGVNREVAYNGPTYTPITLSFLMSANYVEKRIFDRWSNMIVDISKGYDVAYYNSYIGEMQVIALDVKGNAAFTMIYKECWPKTISAIELNHSTQNSPVRLTVEMQYAYWISNDIKSSNDRAGSSVVYETAEAT